MRLRDDQPREMPLGCDGSTRLLQSLRTSSILVEGTMGKISFAALFLVTSLCFLTSCDKRTSAQLDSERKGYATSWVAKMGIEDAKVDCVDYGTCWYKCVAVHNNYCGHEIFRFVCNDPTRFMCDEEWQCTFSDTQR